MHAPQVNAASESEYSDKELKGPIHTPNPPAPTLHMGVTIQLVPPAALSGAKHLKSLINRV
ncbi:hypothetical protein DSLASN_13240 [Desulfoluna limicola]|uniref:Uncharacterized protein n=1 Tax=Desulfoluna limicola TaxID=2810562 RepID=A0ABM7PEV7_9BACT|nr:hypothetical protein DSLASN_13240 [Desulfoluna limicola]